MKTKIDIVSGFLGAGKTTLIRKLILEDFKDEKVVVIENELGRVNIDGEVLKNSGVIVKEITAGCICCSLSGNFDDAITQILEELNPDRIIIEPTGVAMLSEVISSCTSTKYNNLIELNMVITVVDVKRFKLSLSYSAQFLENQIKVTQSVILSKTEGAEHAVIQSVIDKIYEINSEALIINLPWDKVNGADLISALTYKPMEKLSDKNESVKIIGGKRRPRIDAWELETKKEYSKERLNDIFFELEKASEYGNVMRGYV